MLSHCANASCTLTFNHPGWCVPAAVPSEDIYVATVAATARAAVVGDAAAATQLERLVERGAPELLEKAATAAAHGAWGRHHKYAPDVHTADADGFHAAHLIVGDHDQAWSAADRALDFYIDNRRQPTRPEPYGLPGWTIWVEDEQKWLTATAEHGHGADGWAEVDPFSLESVDQARKARVA